MLQLPALSMLQSGSLPAASCHPPSRLPASFLLHLTPPFPPKLGWCVWRGGGSLMGTTIMVMAEKPSVSFHHSLVWPLPFPHFPHCFLEKNGPNNNGMCSLPMPRQGHCSCLLLPLSRQNSPYIIESRRAGRGRGGIMGKVGTLYHGHGTPAWTPSSSRLAGDRHPHLVS